jgi:protein-tyrosine phosphatase
VPEIGQLKGNSLLNRVLNLEGVHNFRDYGGYAVAGGGRLREGLLWRSGQHVDATPADLDEIGAINFTTILDLRGNQERIDYPCARPTGFAATVMFADGETVGGDGHAPHVQAAQSSNTAAGAHTRMVDLYKLMPFRPLLCGIYRDYMQTLAHRDGPSLLHCLAGKDRTGVAAAVAHHLLGVHDDDIMADYLLTNVAGNIERRIAAGAHAVRGNFGRGMDDAAVRVIMSVHEEFLHSAWTAIRAQHGSIRDYARDMLGVDDAMLAAMQDKLIS